MARSPFRKLANLTLLLQNPTGLSVIGDLGQPVIETEPLIVIAYAKTDRSAQREQLLAGELSRMVFSGRAVLPLRIPNTLQPEQKAEAILWRIEKPFGLPEAGWLSVAQYEAFVEANAANIELRGDFFKAPNAPGSAGVERIAGDKIDGYLSLQTVWGEAL